jgi:hypothetical protein
MKPLKEFYSVLVNRLQSGAIPKIDLSKFTEMMREENVVGGWEEYQIKVKEV